MASRDAPPNTEEGLDGQVETILSLVLARSRGEVGNEAVETAFHQLLQHMHQHQHRRQLADARQTRPLVAELPNRIKII